MNYHENDLERDLAAMQDEVPPMPENLHQAWKARIEQEKQESAPVRRMPLRTQIMRGVAAAAAVIFVATGATLTADRTPLTTGGLNQNSTGFKTTNDTAMYGARTMGAPEYEDGVMLTSESGMDIAAADSMTQERKIIRNVSMTISTEAFSDALAGLKDAVTASGGWVENITESGEEGNRRAWMTLRIPADSLDSFLASAGANGRVTNRAESAQDVTDSYYDTQSRLESQQALLARLHELVTLAESLEDILALESQIADTQYQIDRLQESLQRTDRQVDYATVDITLREDTPAEQAADENLSFGQRVLAALQTGGEVFMEFVANAAVWLVSAIPFAAVVAVLWGGWKIIRRKKK